MTKSDYLHVRIAPHDKERLKREAESLNLSLANLIVHAVDQLNTNPDRVLCHSDPPHEKFKGLPCLMCEFQANMP